MNHPPADGHIRTLAKLIAIPSVNPMGRTVDPAIHFERRMTDYLARWFADRGLPTERHVAIEATDIAPAREVLIAGCGQPPADGRPMILLEAHQDTVPTTGMTIDPFRAAVRDGRVYGRGACDVKGSLACLLTVADRLHRSESTARCAVVFAFSVNEEHGYDGAKKLQEIWASGQSALLPHAPDAVLVSEPTELDVVVAHKGVVRWRCRTQGRAAHSSQPSTGENAIYRMAPVVSTLAQFHETVLRARPGHALVGPPTLSVGTIQGGISVNTVPDSCVIEIDRRLLPDESPHGARQEVMDFLADHVDASWVKHEPPFIVSPGLSNRSNAGLAEALLPYINRHKIDARTIGVPFGTDAAYLSLGNTPVVVFGPGSIAQAHTADEWIEIAQLEQAVEILMTFVERYN